ncbi:probable E3 ubiquitin-protein ligase LUL4 [Phoenix dactylifera]|uniref:RING-type E3 ubiquitin transferase n=1 Tax=Phoenix dactylifera TaxID=42345 RepID=A0A8B8J5G3_PHODC|nr:probable E3 ubiquitin-protein ligase LUL4 [Phoenix dactylifera]
MGQSTSTRRGRHHRHRSFNPSSIRPPPNLGLFNPPPPAPPPQPSYLVSFQSTPHHAHHPSPRPPPHPSSSSHYAADRGSEWPSSSSSSFSSSSVNETMVASRQPASYVEHQKATTVKNYVNLHKNSIRLEPDKLNPDHHLVSFTFDSLVDGSFTILYFAKEGLNGSFSLFYPDLCMDVCIPFQKGGSQKFHQPSGTGIDLGFFELDELSKPLDGCFFPLVVYAEPFPLHLPKNELACRSTAAAHAQITEAVIEKNNDGSFQVKVLKQILWVDGKHYELKEIFDVGISAEAGFDGDDSEKECVICMSESRDTAVLPCLHMCMCGECAKVLRLHSNKCPICRQPMETIMEIPKKRQGGRNAECSEA